MGTLAVVLEEVGIAMNRLPDSAIERDHSLEKATDKASVALMEHRWHWTLDESNPDRVSMREYARQVGRAQHTIQNYARGYAIYQADTPGRISPEEARRRAGMSVETEAATEAVAKERRIAFGYAQKEFGDEARRIRETARQRAEEKGTSVMEEIPQAATITYKAERSEREQYERARQRTPVRAIETEKYLRDARQALIKAIRASENVPFSVEERELLGETLDSIKRLLVIADRAVLDAYDKSWKAEFQVMEGGLAAS